MNFCEDFEQDSNYECLGCSNKIAECVCSGEFIIEDSYGNHLYKDKVFPTYEDGWSFLYEQFPVEMGEEEAEEELNELWVVEK